MSTTPGADKIGGRSEGEADLLDCATSEVKEAGRLSGQIKISPKLEGFVVHLPGSRI